MKIIVPIKRVIDANVRIRVLSDQSGVDTENVKMSINPFCEIAVESALRLKEAGLVDEITVITIGQAACQDILRTAMAMGADRGIHVETGEQLQSLAIARVLRAVVEQELPGLVILGKQAIDNDNNQTGQMLAGLLGWAQGTFASAIKLNNDKVEVTREIDGGMETLALQLPAVITADLRLNEPRYVKLPEIVRARKKPLDTVKLSDMGVDTGSNLEVLNVSEQPARNKGVILENVHDLVTALKTKELIP